MSRQNRWILAHGVDSSVAGLDEMSAAARKAYVRQNRINLEMMMADSQREVPVDTSRLKNSKYMRIHESPDGLLAEAGYSVEYAVPVHERLDLNHTVGKAMFLADPMNRALAKWHDRVAKEVRKALKGRSKRGKR